LNSTGVSVDDPVRTHPLNRMCQRVPRNLALKATRRGVAQPPNFGAEADFGPASDTLACKSLAWAEAA
jgi:hypothetical protein